MRYLIRHVNCKRILIRHVKCMRYLIRHVKCMRLLIRHVKCMRYLILHVKCMGYFNSPSKMSGYFNSACKMCHLILTPKKRHRVVLLIGWIKFPTRHEALPRFGKWGVISMEFLRSFLRRHFAGKPVVVSPNVGCFLRLLPRHPPKTCMTFFFNSFLC